MDNTTTALCNTDKNGFFTAGNVIVISVTA